MASFDLAGKQSNGGVAIRMVVAVEVEVEVEVEVVPQALLVTRGGNTS
jgi:hypothetical protein